MEEKKRFDRYGERIYNGRYFDWKMLQGVQKAEREEIICLDFVSVILNMTFLC